MSADHTPAQPPSGVANPDGKQRTPRLRLSLKLLLILIAIVSIGWFGARTLRPRRADQILARHDAVVDAIIENVMMLPPNTSFKDQPLTREELEKLLGQTWPAPAVRRKAVLEFGAAKRAVVMGVHLDISQLPTDDATTKQLANRLVECYTTGLAEVGLKRVVSGGGISIWKSPDNDLDVSIDADVHPDSKSADVRIIFIDNQQLSLW